MISIDQCIKFDIFKNRTVVLSAHFEIHFRGNVGVAISGAWIGFRLGS